MKRLHLYLLLMILSGIIFGCAGDDENVIVEGSTIAKSHNAKICEEEAKDIALRVLGRNNRGIATRSEKFLMNCEYVLGDSGTRSESCRNVGRNDTVAYVLNFPESRGFVIVASSRHVYPVLAFSSEGEFSFTNEIAKKNFIDNIESYLAAADKNEEYSVGENDFDGCYDITPKIQTSISQDYPWNKCIIVEHPGCPAGCVAVATALVMVHTRSKMTYHGQLFYFDSIMKAIKDFQQDQNNSNAPKRIVGVNPNPPAQPEYTYEDAVNSMAKLLYCIGIDVDMDYKEGISSAYSEDAYDLFKRYGFIVPSGYENFNIKTVTGYLKNNCIVYLRGFQIAGGGTGHAWVSDGCYFCVETSNRNNITETYIHCDWGFGGKGNGYFSGSVFESEAGDFVPMNYFAVKIQK